MKFAETAKSFIIALMMELKRERNPGKRLKIIDEILDRGRLGELDWRDLKSAMDEGDHDADRAQNN